MLKSREATSYYNEDLSCNTNTLTALKLNGRANATETCAHTSSLIASSQNGDSSIANSFFAAHLQPAEG